MSNTETHMLGDSFRWGKQSHDLTKEKGQISAILFCEEMIQNKQKQINEMQFYDGDRITALQNSMMDWGAIRSMVEKGFA